MEGRYAPDIEYVTMDTSVADVIRRRLDPLVVKHIMQTRPMNIDGLMMDSYTTGYRDAEASTDPWVDTRLVKLDLGIIMGHGYDWEGFEDLRSEMHTPEASFAVWPETSFFAERRSRRWSMYCTRDGSLSIGGYSCEAHAKEDAESMALSMAKHAARMSAADIESTAEAKLQKLRSLVVPLLIGTCGCGTKHPGTEHHDATCPYKRASLMADVLFAPKDKP